MCVSFDLSRDPVAPNPPPVPAAPVATPPALVKVARLVVYEDESEGGDSPDWDHPELERARQQQRLDDLLRDLPAAAKPDVVLICTGYTDRLLESRSDLERLIEYSHHHSGHGQDAGEAKYFEEDVSDEDEVEAGKGGVAFVMDTGSCSHPSDTWVNKELAGSQEALAIVQMSPGLGRGNVGFVGIDMHRVFEVVEFLGGLRYCACCDRSSIMYIQWVTVHCGESKLVAIVTMNTESG